MTLRWEDLCR
jgi:hypothetical protein